MSKNTQNTLNDKSRRVMNDCVYSVITDAIELKNRNEINFITSYINNEIPFRCLTIDNINKLMLQTRIDNCIIEYNECSINKDDLVCIDKYNKCINIDNSSLNL